MLVLCPYKHITKYKDLVLINLIPYFKPVIGKTENCRVGLVYSCDRVPDGCSPASQRVQLQIAYGKTNVQSMFCYHHTIEYSCRVIPSQQP